MEAINSFEILISLIKACQDKPEEPNVRGPNGYDSTLGGAHYLLGQCIRNLWTREGHRCVSKKAHDLWERLEVGKPIFDYWYQKPVYYRNTEPVHVKGYVGAKSTPDWEEDLRFTKKGDYFRFRQVFHIEHIVPIGIILKELLELDISKDRDEVYGELNSILGKIYVCYMTKEEDRCLNKVAKSNRSDDYLEVINTDYRKAGIEISEWDE